MKYWSQLQSVQTIFRQAARVSLKERMLTELKIAAIDDFPSFLSLKEEWTEILGRCDHSVFSTWEWLTIWWKYFGNNKKLVLLLAKNGSDVIGIAPLMYSVHRMFGLRQGKIEFIGVPDSDYNDFLLTEKREDCVNMFLHHLTKTPENWNCIDLRDISETTQYLNILRNVSNTVEFAQELKLYECPFTRLPSSIDIFKDGLNSKFKKTLRRTARQLEKSFSVEFTDCSSLSTLDQNMNAFFELHQKRWNAKGRRGVFSDQETRDFHRDVAKCFLKKGWLGLFLLKLSDIPVAALYGFRYKSKFYFYLSGFDPQYSKYGVANLLIEHAMSNCVQEGLTEFDFMRGAEEYKYRWNTLSRWNHKVVLIRKGFLAASKNSLYNHYWSYGNKLKYLLKIR
jgi:CelD/BcsL family acetyltransferase involved in cellulose biosynthesis